MKDYKHAILFVGSRNSGKISRVFLRRLKKLKILGTRAFSCPNPESTHEIIKKLNLNEKYKKVFVLLLYCEDTDKHRGFSNIVDLGTNIENLIKSQSNKSKFKILHRTEIGIILGDKIKTNRFFSANGVPVPRMITNPNYDRQVFVNAVCGSRSSETSLVKDGSMIDNKKYNTEYIDTTYEYLGKTYYVSPRVFCLGGKITHFIIRCSPTSRNDVVVRTPWDVTYEEAPGLQYDFFKTQIVPEYKYLEEMFEKAGSLLGFGGHCYDLLRDVKNKRWYISEAMFKFDSAASVRKSPYSVITYRQIQKEVYGKVFSNDAEMEELENVPLGIKEWYTKDFFYKNPQGKFKYKTYYLPKAENDKKIESVLYWIEIMFKKYFEDIYKYNVKKHLKDESIKKESTQ